MTRARKPTRVKVMTLPFDRVAAVFADEDFQEFWRRHGCELPKTARVRVGARTTSIVATAIRPGGGCRVQARVTVPTRDLFR